MEEEGEVPSRVAAELRMKGTLPGSAMQAPNTWQENQPKVEPIPPNLLALTQGPARSFTRSAAPENPVTQCLESHANPRCGDFAPERFSLVSNVQSSLQDTMVSLMNEVSTVDMVFAKDDDAYFTHHLPHGTRLRVLFGADHLCAPPRNYDELRSKFIENDGNQVAVLPTHIH